MNNELNLGTHWTMYGPCGYSKQFGYDLDEALIYRLRHGWSAALYRIEGVCVDGLCLWQ